MASRNENYAEFYVAEPFSARELTAHASKDFCHYNVMRAWKGAKLWFPFNNSHEKTYKVRKSSDWESTLKLRPRELFIGRYLEVFQHQPVSFNY